MWNVKKLVISAGCIAVLAIGIWAGKYLITVQKYKDTIKKLEIGTVDLSKVSDGKYTGGFDALLISAKVEVTISNKKIKNIVLLNHKNERGKPAEVITDRVVQAQSLQVDAISGATNSSKVILKAIENALKAGQA